MKNNRAEVYKAVDSERDYQDQLIRNEVNHENAGMTPISNLVIIEELCSRIKQEFYDSPGYPSMDNFRKIAATAVRTMEAFGATERK